MPTTVKELQDKLKLYDLNDVDLNINQVAIDDHIDAKMNQITDEKHIYTQKIAELELELESYKSKENLRQNVLLEVQALNPQFIGLTINDKNVTILWKKINKKEIRPIEIFLARRLNNENLKFTHSVLL